MLNCRSMTENKVIISSVDMDERAKLGIRSGDTVRVWIKIQEKDKTRLQAFEGLVLAVKHGSEAGGTFTVRKVASGVGVEKIFPLYSPIIDKIEIVKRAKVRRAKLYFLRDKVAREVKRVLRRTKIMGVSTKGLTELEDERKRAEAEEEKRKEEEEKRATEEARAKEEATAAEEKAKNEEAPTEEAENKEENVEDEKDEKGEKKEEEVKKNETHSEEESADTAQDEAVESEQEKPKDK